jgi:hypothetical protein
MLIKKKLFRKNQPVSKISDWIRVRPVLRIRILKLIIMHFLVLMPSLFIVCDMNPLICDEYIFMLTL